MNAGRVVAIAVVTVAVVVGACSEDKAASKDKPSKDEPAKPQPVAKAKPPAPSKKSVDDNTGYKTPTGVPLKLENGDWAKTAAKDKLENKTYGKVDPKTLAVAPSPKAVVPPAGATAPAYSFRVSYVPSKQAMHETIRASFQKERVWERMAQMLNAIVKLPKNIDINMADCGQPNAFYDPNRSRIIMCYELVVYFATLFRPVAKTTEELGIRAVLASVFLFFHETGHALRHVLNLPVTGPEEDAVDELATLLLLEIKDGQYVAAVGAEAFQLIHKDKQRRGATLPFWDEHSLGEQRYYHVLCLIYGANTKANHKLVDQGYLPQARARRCESDYQNKSKAWQTLLKPHFTALVLEAIANQTTVAAPSGADGCSKAVTRMVVLLRALVAKSQPAKLAEFDRKVPTDMPRMLGVCAKQWTPQQRTCVFNAADFPQAQACFAKR